MRFILICERRKMRQKLVSFCFLSGILLSPVVLGIAAPSSAQVNDTRRVNVPFFGDDIVYSETAIFWFGHVSPTDNSVDVRIGYNEEEILVNVAVFDRRLWYDTSPSLDDLTAWDAVTLYLDLNGNAGNTPDANAYRFDSQLVWWEARDNYQAAYQGNGSTWIEASVPFTTTSFWRGNEPNDDNNDRGWALQFTIPFSSLGVSSPPEQSTIWGLALSVHDRDDASGTPIDDQVWPETMETPRSATWGQLAFGIPTYSSPPAIPDATVTIRQGLNETVVMDGAVGGDTVCGSGLDYWTEWGQTNYAGSEHVNIQNQIDVADWPCFSRYYVNFLLNTLPNDKVIKSATLTLHLFGSAGEGWEPGPQPSFIQVLTTDGNWEENTLTWNNAPLAKENISGTWVEPVNAFPGWPGIPWEWDISRAVAEAYATGGPRNLALYESGWAYHGGKYLVSSDAGDWNQVARPTLTIVLGQALVDLDKAASPTSGSQGTQVNYTLSFTGTGNRLSLIDMLPSGIGAPTSLELTGTNVTPIYDSNMHSLTWADSPTTGQEITIRYVCNITATAPQILVNTAELSTESGESSFASTTIIANSDFKFYLPLTSKN